MGAAGRECLELLALIERPLGWDEVRGLLVSGGSSPKDAEAALQTVHWRNLVRTELQTERRLITVIHPDLAEAISDMLSPEWRRALHRRIGQLFARHVQSGRGDALEAASHLHRGGMVQAAAPYFEIAGELAAQERRHGEAVAHYQKALEGTEDVSARGLVFLKIARAFFAGYQPEKAREFLDEALRRARSAGPEWLFYQVLFDKIRQEHLLGNDQGARAVFEELQEELPSFLKGDEVLLLETDLLFSSGELKESHALLQSIEERKELIRSPDHCAEMLRRKGRIENALGNCREALMAYEEGIQHLKEHGDSLVMGALLGDYGADLRRMGSPVEARRTLREALVFLAESERPDLFAEALFQLGWTLTDLGSNSTARRRVNEAFRFAELLGQHCQQHRIAAFLGTLVIRRQEERSFTVEKVLAVLEILERCDDHVVERAEILIELGEMFIAMHLAEQGPKILQRGRQLAYQIGAGGLLPPVVEET